MKTNTISSLQLEDIVLDMASACCLLNALEDSEASQSTLDSSPVALSIRGISKLFDSCNERLRTLYDSFDDGDV